MNGATEQKAEADIRFGFTFVRLYDSACYFPSVDAVALVTDADWRL